MCREMFCQWLCFSSWNPDRGWYDKQWLLSHVHCGTCTQDRTHNRWVLRWQACKCVCIIIIIIWPSLFRSSPLKKLQPRGQSLHASWANWLEDYEPFYDWERQIPEQEWIMWRDSCCISSGSVLFVTWINELIQNETPSWASHWLLPQAHQQKNWENYTLRVVKTSSWE